MMEYVVGIYDSVVNARFLTIEESIILKFSLLFSSLNLIR